MYSSLFFFFFQAEDGIRDLTVTGVQTCALPICAAASHVTRVLRLRVGEALTVFNGSGGEYAARIEQAHGGRVAVAIGEARAIERESPLTLTLPQGVSRGERMDLGVPEATELGMSPLVPGLTQR